jgi:hypothetical protein
MTSTKSLFTEAVGHPENVLGKSHASSNLAGETHELTIKLTKGFDRPVDLTRILSKQAGLSLADALEVVNQLTDRKIAVTRIHKNDAIAVLTAVRSLDIECTSNPPVMNSKDENARAS